MGGCHGHTEGPGSAAIELMAGGSTQAGCSCLESHRRATGEPEGHWEWCQVAPLPAFHRSTGKGRSNQALGGPCAKGRDASQETPRGSGSC